jgi:FdrA protein
MTVRNQIRKNVYHDSATLMLLTSALERSLGKQNIAVMMGTDMNKALLRDSGLLTRDGDTATPNDLIFATRAESEERATEAIVLAEERLQQQQVKREHASYYRTRTLSSALQWNSKANVVVISVPGQYACGVAREALENDLHVMLFSDNVSLKDEVELKEIATERGVLMMGPDCGTAILNGVPLGFANVVNRGKIGIVAASGTGLQECSVLISRYGGGISHAIGTGGRDIHSRVEGRMMRSALQIMERDPDTEVIVVISKPPSPEALVKIREQLVQSAKPIVACFLGETRSPEKIANITAVRTIEEAARRALAISGIHGSEVNIMDAFRDQIAEERGRLLSSQKFIRGLYTGGTLCHEAMLIMREVITDIHGNITDAHDGIPEDTAALCHTLIDLGADEFTHGRVHPMIDPEIRNSWIREQGSDKSVAVILLDVVIGYGSHPDPAGVVAEAICDIKQQARYEGRHIAVVLSVCGTEGDPQGYGAQVRALHEAGALVLPSNAAAVRCALEIIKPEDLNEEA